MNTSPAYDRVRAALEAHGRRIRGNQAQCPAHGDRSESLSFTRTGARVLLNCHAGCTTDEVVAALGLTMRDLFDVPRDPRPTDEGWMPCGHTRVADYEYTDPAGTVIFGVARCDRKGKGCQGFRQWRPDASKRKGRAWSAAGVKKVPYRLHKLVPAVAAGTEVVLVEGEQDVRTAEALGLVATSNPGGASQWKPTYAQWFTGAHLTVIVDRDPAGLKWAEAVRADLIDVVASLQFKQAHPDLGDHADLTDHIRAGHSLAELVPLHLGPADPSGPVSTLPAIAPAGDHGGQDQRHDDDPRLPPIIAGALTGTAGEIWKRLADLPGSEWPEYENVVKRRGIKGCSVTRDLIAYSSMIGLDDVAGIAGHIADLAQASADGHTGLVIGLHRVARRRDFDKAYFPAYLALRNHVVRHLLRTAVHPVGMDAGCPACDGAKQRAKAEQNAEQFLRDLFGKDTVADKLLRLAREHYSFLVAPDGKTYAIEKAGRNIAWPLTGRGSFRRHLARRYHAAHAAVPAGSAILDAMTVLEGDAEDQDPTTVWLRAGRHDDCLVLDLGDTAARAVIIRPGSWEIVDTSPVPFRRTALTLPIPAPERACAPASAERTDWPGLAKLRKLLNVTDADFQLLTAWQVTTLDPLLDHPALGLLGAQGTAKSSATRQIAQLTDPSSVPTRSSPKDEEDWQVAAAGSWIVPLDNISHVSQWLSDSLAKAVTGNGSVRRMRFTDEELSILVIHRCLVLNGIEFTGMGADLLERLLQMELELIDESMRKSKKAILATFEALRPAALADILDIAAAGLKVLPTVSEADLPRMADFTVWLRAVDAVTGWNTEATYLVKLTTVMADAAKDDAFAMGLKTALELTPAGADEVRRVEKAAGEILEWVNRLVPEPARPAGWPKDATRAGAKLRRLAAALRAIDVVVRIPDPTDGRRLWTLELHPAKESR